MGLDLSEQAFLDCDETNACQIGANISTYVNLFSTKLQWRFLKESNYPYRGNKTSDCPKHVEWYNPGAEVEAIYTVDDCNEEKLKYLVIFFCCKQCLKLFFFISFHNSWRILFLLIFLFSNTLKAHHFNNL